MNDIFKPLLESVSSDQKQKVEDLRSNFNSLTESLDNVKSELNELKLQCGVSSVNSAIKTFKKAKQKAEMADQLLEKLSTIRKKNTALNESLNSALSGKVKGVSVDIEELKKSNSALMESLETNSIALTREIDGIAASLEDTKPLTESEDNENKLMAKLVTLLESRIGDNPKREPSNSVDGGLACITAKGVPLPTYMDNLRERFELPKFDMSASGINGMLLENGNKFKSHIENLKEGKRPTAVISKVSKGGKTLDTIMLEGVSIQERLDTLAENAKGLKLDKSDSDDGDTLMERRNRLNNSIPSSGFVNSEIDPTVSKYI